VSTLSLAVPSFAKINWFLRILGRRPDGYHEVQTVMQTVSLHDELSFEVRADDQITLSCSDDQLPVDESNLVVRAANALRRHSRTTRGVSIRLEKRIPTKAGLGGASSNAAVTLMALTHLWELGISSSALLELGGTLGADVPFFFSGGLALATGTGTDVEPLTENHRGKIPLLIITPKATVSTVEAYRALQSPALTSTNDESILSSSRAQALTSFADPSLLQNDFEDVILRAQPEIERAKKALQEAGAIGSLLAGSGSSVFGVFENEDWQARAAKDIHAETGWRIFPATSISRREYLAALGPCGVLLSNTRHSF
jgi:4-diphosphocytidyl-2-C-methyl-D-erythritol kinase